MKVTRDKRASRWDAHRQERRVALVDAAILAIREHGAGVGMDEVAAQAATSKTVVYRHFATRTLLYVAVCARVADVLLGQIREAVTGAAGPRDQVAAGIEAYLRLIEHDPEVYRFVVHRPLVDRPLVDTATGHGPDPAPEPDPVADLVTVIGDEAAAVIAEQLRRTGAATVAAVPWGHGLVGLVRGAADNWLVRPAGMTRAELATHLTDLAWAGISGVLAASEEQS
ncbi:TetR family transcriptional regulator [Pseudonocardia sp. GCM10023141]|uniref:TetR family transcriptional regulator n=1 Tax=Pseudonocardia sp. GCM10023141 TaxID=3252653 RepID=UPI003618CF53